VAEKKKIAVLKRALARARAKKRLVIIDMPEEDDSAPHWLLWVAGLSLVGLAGGIIWQLVATNSHLQAYLPFL